MKIGVPVFLVIAVALSIATPSLANALRVKGDAPGPIHDGMTWATAFTTVQEAISASAFGGEVWVAAGTYAETITLKAGVSVYAGFSGADTARDERDPRDNVATIQNASDTILIATAPGIGADTIVDGLTLQRVGAALRSLLCDGSAPTVRNCIFTTFNAKGQAVVCRNGAAPRLIGNIFVGGRASNGSVLFADKSRPVLHNNTAWDNADAFGYTSSGFQVYLTASSPEFVNNIFGAGSPVVYLATGSPVYRNNCFQVIFGQNSPVGRNGNIGQNPRFLTAALPYSLTDLRLDLASPCIDAGDSGVVEAGETDLDGRPRVQGARVDMGAYEAGVPTRLAFAVQPGDAQPGASFGVQPAVEAQDSAGRRVLNFTGTITLQPAPGSAYPFTLLGSVRRNAQKGAVTFTSAGIVEAGEGAVLRAGAPGVEPGDSEPFRVASRPTKWGFAVQPSGGQPGLRLVRQPVVAAQDAAGRTLTEYNGLVSLTLKGTAGVLLGTTTLPVVKGIAAFVDIGVEGTGRAYTLLATGGDLLPGQSAPFALGLPAVMVTPSGDDANDGASWDTPKMTVGAALGVVMAPGGEVHVGAGRYLEHVTLADGVRLYGGYAGTVSGDDARDPLKNETILDGGQYANPGFVVTAPAGVGLETVLDGFIIERGMADSGSNYPGLGGGIRCAGGSPTITNNTIRYNLSYRLGAGILCEGASPLVKGNRFRQNTNGGTPMSNDYYGYGFGGGLACVSNSAPLIEGNEFEANHAVAGGAAIFSDSSTPVIRGNVIDGNQCTIGDSYTISEGGGIFLYRSAAELTNNYITNNVADAGAGIYSLLAPSTISIVGNVIAGNSALSWGGGGLSSMFDSVDIRRNVIVHNTAFSPDNRSNRGAGAEFALTGGVLEGNVIAWNAITGGTSEGGGLYISGGDDIAGPTAEQRLTVRHNTIIGNAGVEGGAMCFYRSGATVSSNIVSGNTSAVDNQGEVAFAPVLRGNCFYANGDAPFTGLPDPSGADGNITADPRLAPADYGNVHIQPDSPCRDAALSETGLDTLDIDGQARVQGPAPDIGADESDGTVWTAAPRVVRVRPDGDDAADGSSWSRAMATPAAAARALAFSPAGDGDIWLAEGAYLGPVVLGPRTSVYGGFRGNEARRDDHSRAPDKTVLYGVSEYWIPGITIPSYARGLTVESISVTGFFAGFDAYSSDARIHRCIAQACSEIGINCRANPVIDDNLIANNGQAGVYCEGGGTPTIRNNTIVGHNQPDAAGISVYIPPASLGPNLIVNNIVANNAKGITYLVWPPTPGPPPGTRNNIVWGNSQIDYEGVIDPTGTNGNLRADPLFVDAGNGDFRLAPGSPCIDSGDTSVVAPGDEELEGNPRILGAHVDIGAYEYLPAGYFAMGDLASSLRILGGLTIASATDLARLNLADSGTPLISLVDVVRIARKLAGLDPNP